MKLVTSQDSAEQLARVLRPLRDKMQKSFPNNTDMRDSRALQIPAIFLSCSALIFFKLLSYMI